MKTFVTLTFAILLNSINGYTQSKTETEQWLLSKLNKYTLRQFELLYRDGELGSYGSSLIENYSFRFEDPYLIVSFREKRSTIGSYGSQDKKSICNYEYKIPIAYFQDIVITNANAKNYIQDIGYINAIKYQILVTKEGAMQVTSNGIKMPYTPLKLDLLISSEEEDFLPQRLNKAFLLLRSLYSKPKAKPKGEGELF